MSLDAIEAAAAETTAGTVSSMRGTPMINCRDIAGLGVFPISQPGYLYDFGYMFLRTLGERAHGQLPLRAELARGIPSC